MKYIYIHEMIVPGLVRDDDLLGVGTWALWIRGIELLMGGHRTGPICGGVHVFGLFSVEGICVGSRETSARLPQPFQSSELTRARYCGRNWVLNTFFYRFVDRFGIDHVLRRSRMRMGPNGPQRSRRSRSARIPLHRLDRCASLFAKSSNERRAFRYQSQ